MVMANGCNNGPRPAAMHTAINQAKANNVAAHTVAAGNSVREFALKRMAVETGGTCTKMPDMRQVVRFSSVFKGGLNNS